MECLRLAARPAGCQFPVLPRLLLILRIVCGWQQFAPRASASAPRRTYSAKESPVEDYRKWVLDQAVGVAEDAWLDAAQRAILCLSGEEELQRLLTLSAVFKV